MKKTIIIDGHSIIFKTYFSMIRTPLITKSGKNVTILHGFLNKILSIIDKYSPDNFVIAFDSKEDTFRKKMYSNYKANRSKAPEEINIQTPILIDILKEMGFHTLIAPGFEADDIIATVAKNRETDEKIYIYSVDKDLYQLIDKNINMISSRTAKAPDIIYDENKVFEKLGIKTTQMQDYLALIGDSSDNIPGVKGVGPKRAVSLLNKYDNLDNLYKYVHTVKSKSLQEKLIENKDMAYLSKTLVKLSTDVNQDLKKDKWIIPKTIPEKALEMLQQYELKTIYERLTGKSLNIQTEYNTINSNNYYLISTFEELQDGLNKISNCEYVSLDTETDSIDAIDANIKGFSFSVKENEAYYCDLTNQKNKKLELLNKFLKDSDIKVIGQNFKYDLKVLNKYSVSINNLAFDTMIAGKLLSNENEKINMDYMAEKYLRYKTIKYSDIVPKGKSIVDIDLEILKNYACEDADITYRLFKLFDKMLQRKKLEKIFYLTEMPLINILTKMELTGILIDNPYFEKLNINITDKIDLIKSEIYNLAEEEFLISSTKQLKTILFEKLDLPIIKSGKTGPSTSEDVLLKLAEEHDLPAKIIEYRKLLKLKNTYIEPLLKLKKEDGRIHTTYNQAFVETGRLSSTHPNMQNIPSSPEYGYSIKKGFISKKNHIFLSADYSQIELRVLAEFANDKNLTKAFKEGEDIHLYTASNIFQKSQNEISYEERQIAKTINFGVIYGLSPFGLSKQLEISRGDANNFINMYFDKFPGIKNYRIELAEICKKRGYTETLLGRKRYIKLLRSNNKNDIKMGSRIALNTQIQGTAAEIMKLGMIETYNYLNKTNIEEKQSNRMLLQIHDEIICEINSEKANSISKDIKEILENVTKNLNWSIPLKVNIALGKSWDQLK